MSSSAMLLLAMRPGRPVSWWARDHLDRARCRTWNSRRYRPPRRIPCGQRATFNPRFAAKAVEVLVNDAGVGWPGPVRGRAGLAHRYGEGAAQRRLAGRAHRRSPTQL